MQTEAEIPAGTPDCTRQIIQRAVGQIGVPFRLHGREPGVGLDCVGLAAYALWGQQELKSLPSGYSLRGYHMAQLEAELKSRQIFRCAPHTTFIGGDLAIFEPAARQLHLGIYIGGHLGAAFVHAHAGLRRIVMTPEIGAWKLADHWRPCGA